MLYFQNKTTGKRVRSLSATNYIPQRGDGGAALVDVRQSRSELLLGDEALIEETGVVTATFHQVCHRFLLLSCPGTSLFNHKCL